MDDNKRRLYGFMVGVLFGLPYSIVSQYINIWTLPGIPLYDLPIGRMETLIFGTLAMGALGLVVAWHEESFFGLIGGSIFVVLLGSVQAYVNSGISQAATSFFLFLFTFLPRLVIYLPLAFLLRWALRNFDTGASGRPPGLKTYLKTIGVLLAVAVIGGWFSILAPEARDALQNANGLVREGMSARDSGSNLPAALIPVDGFATYAVGDYTLEWSSDVDMLPVTRPPADFGVTESLILFHFENGYLFGCAHTPPANIPKCINISRVR